MPRVPTSPQGLSRSPTRSPFSAKSPATSPMHKTKTKPTSPNSPSRPRHHQPSFLSSDPDSAPTTPPRPQSTRPAAAAAGAGALGVAAPAAQARGQPASDRGVGKVTCEFCGKVEEEGGTMPCCSRCLTARCGLCMACMRTLSLFVCRYRFVFILCPVQVLHGRMPDSCLESWPQGRLCPQV